MYVDVYGYLCYVSIIHIRCEVAMVTVRLLSSSHKTT